MALHSTWVVLMLVLSLRGQVQTGKIIGGRPAVPHSRPYMVLLEMKTLEEPSKFCAGFLISDEFVLTAAHCEARNTYVHLGLHKLIPPPTREGIRVRRAIPHKEFNNKTGYNDLMLLQLMEKVNFTENVRPINLASRSDHLPQRCIVSGWGFTSKDNQNLARELMEVNLTLAKDTSCLEPHAFFSLGEIGPSHGDSGGPLVCEGEVAYGVVSRANKSCPPYKYKVFIKIPDYLGWIESYLMQK
ncbi:unnamed protein product [Boreogadus saida]